MVVGKTYPSPPLSSESNSGTTSSWGVETPPSACGQPLHHSILRAIRRGKYINFSLHLPHPPQLDPDHKGRLPPTVTTPGSRPPTPVVSHPSDHKPGHMAMRLLHTTVHYDGLYSYDRDFQLKLSNDPSIRWDSLDQELWTLWCTSQARPFCSKCHKHGHNSAVCTMKNRSSFVPINGHTICLHFNNSACLNTSKCKYAHVYMCFKCEGEHPSPTGTCSRRTT